jgi:hypothetical protein
MNAFTDCRFCGSEICAHDRICSACGKNVCRSALGVLPQHEQDNWQEMMDWSNMHDDADNPRQFWGESPKFLGLTLAQWVATNLAAPEVVAAFDLKPAIDRWHKHRPSGDDKYDYRRAISAQARRKWHLPQETAASQPDALTEHFKAKGTGRDAVAA